MSRGPSGHRPRVVRLRTVSPRDPGWTRRRHGRGFSYRDQAGTRLEAHEVERIRSLAIPPAWQDVWICPSARGHIQAVGTDAAGRRQYLYHPVWRQQRDGEKFERVAELGRRMPRLREAVDEDLENTPSGCAAVLAATIRLIDLGGFRIGSEDHLADTGNYGLTTLEIRHVRRGADGLVFTFVGKSGVDHEILVEDDGVARVVRAVVRGRDDDDRLLCSLEEGEWAPVTPEQVNARIRQLTGLPATAKDIRTWHATVLGAQLLAEVEPATAQRARRRQVRAVMAEVADFLGNTPTMAEKSYVDPRVVDLFDDGDTIAGTMRRLHEDPRARQDQLDRAVSRLLLRAED